MTKLKKKFCKIINYINSYEKGWGINIESINIDGRK